MGAQTSLEREIWRRAQPEDDDEFRLLMNLSEDLKAEADLRRGSWQDRPATLKQVLAAGLLEYEVAVTLSREKLSLFCSAYQRGQLAEEVQECQSLTGEEARGGMVEEALGTYQPRAGMACSCGKSVYARGRCVACYQAWYRQQRRARAAMGLT